MKSIQEQFEEYWGRNADYNRCEDEVHAKRIARNLFFAGYCAAYNETIREKGNEVEYHNFSVAERDQIEKELDDWSETR